VYTKTEFDFLIKMQINLKKMRVWSLAFVKEGVYLTLLADWAKKQITGTHNDHDEKEKGPMSSMEDSHLNFQINV
jgi:hypothetical protein